MPLSSPDASFYLFDSHSRDECGLSVPDGKSCLLTFPNICELEKYIQVAYLEYQSLTTIYFQVQFLIIEVPFEISRYLLTNFIEKKKSFYQELKENKAKKQIKKNIVTNFKKSIQEGPFYICVSCHRCLYHVSVIKFVKERYYIEVFSVAITSFDGKLYICKTCDLQLLKKKTPCQSVLNKLYLDDLPAELQSIRRLDRVLIAKRIISKKIASSQKVNLPN